MARTNRTPSAYRPLPYWHLFNPAQLAREMLRLRANAAGAGRQGCYLDEALALEMIVLMRRDIRTLER